MSFIPERGDVVWINLDPQAAMNKQESALFLSCRLQLITAGLGSWFAVP